LKSFCIIPFEIWWKKNGPLKTKIKMTTYHHAKPISSLFLRTTKKVPSAQKITDLDGLLEI